MGSGASLAAARRSGAVAHDRLHDSRSGEPRVT